MLPFTVRSFSASSKTKVANSVAPATAFSISQFEHRLSSQPSPMVSLAMTVPAGTKYSVDSKDSGSVAAYYKHAILQVTQQLKAFTYSFRELKMKLESLWQGKQIYARLRLKLLKIGTCCA